MSFLLSCPHCGPRPVDEYAYFGEVTRRPQGSPTLRELSEYVYFRDNVAGVQREWWQHLAGCGEWFLAERDTRTNEVVDVSSPEPERVVGGVRPVGSDPGGSEPERAGRPVGSDPGGSEPKRVGSEGRPVGSDPGGPEPDAR